MVECGSANLATLMAKLASFDRRLVTDAVHGGKGRHLIA